jgi:uncharacterized membrane protein YjdF
MNAEAMTRSLGGAMLDRVTMAMAGFFVGGFLGWFIGVAWYELIEVPKAASMDYMMAQTYLCATGNALPLLAAVLCAILGAIIGALSGKPSIHYGAPPSDLP